MLYNRCVVRLWHNRIAMLHSWVKCWVINKEYRFCHSPDWSQIFLLVKWMVSKCPSCFPLGIHRDSAKSPTWGCEVQGPHGTLWFLLGLWILPIVFNFNFVVVVKWGKVGLSYPPVAGRCEMPGDHHNLMPMYQNSKVFFLKRVVTPRFLLVWWFGFC